MGNLDTFQTKAEGLCEALRDLVDENMVNDGDTCETSQRICLLNALANVERNINGTEEEDLLGGDIRSDFDETLSEQPQTNIEFITELMDFPRSGPLMQGFVMTALEKYALRSKSITEEEWGQSMISLPAWKMCANEILEKLDERYKKDTK